VARREHREVTPEMKKDLKLGDADGAFVYNVYRNSPATRGGPAGDFITSINGQGWRTRPSSCSKWGTSLSTRTRLRSDQGGERASLT